MNPRQKRMIQLALSFLRANLDSCLEAMEVEEPNRPDIIDFRGETIPAPSDSELDELEGVINLDLLNIHWFDLETGPNDEDMLRVNVTHEGIIADVVNDGEIVRTCALLAEDIEEMTH